MGTGRSGALGGLGHWEVRGTGRSWALGGHGHWEVRGTGRSGALGGQGHWEVRGTVRWGHWEVRGTGRSRSGGHCQLSLDKKLKEVEVKQAILVRWTPSSTEYRELERQVLDNKREYLLLGIWEAAKWRMFLLKLKAKYAGKYSLLGSVAIIINYSDGQKIAKRLAGQILKEVNAIKGLLQKYNSCLEDSSKAMTYTSVLDPAVISTLLSKVTTYDLGSRKENYRCLPHATSEQRGKGPTANGNTEHYFIL